MFPAHDVLLVNLHILGLIMFQIFNIVMNFFETSEDSIKFVLHIHILLAPIPQEFRHESIQVLGRAAEVEGDEGGARWEREIKITPMQLHCGLLSLLIIRGEWVASGNNYSSIFKANLQWT